ncbi:Endonuclease/exonuclease/phosphatase, partial [Lactifluus volemus]
TSLTLVTWNVDFMMPNASSRLTAALDYLQYRVFPGSECGQPPPCIILLQEIKAGDFSTLLAHPWVREWFAVVPGSANDGWPRGATYGTVTLVARNESMPLAGSTCVHFGGSRMARNALVTDVLLRGAGSGGRVLRVVNTHLESLPEGTPQRIVQMGVIAGLLKKAGMLGGIVGGDMNAIAVSDETLAEKNGLMDARKGDDDVGAAEEDDDDNDDNDDDGGVTWGYQPRTRYPPGRLDRILYTMNEDGDLKIENVRRIAVGLEMPGGVGRWVSDHYGLACQVR